MRRVSWTDIALLLLVGIAAYSYAVRTPQQRVQSRSAISRTPTQERIIVPNTIPLGNLPTAPANVSTPEDPVARLEQEIFAADAGRMPDPVLQRQYAEINETFFQNALPEVPVLWEPRLSEVGRLTDPDLVVQGLTDGRAILLNASLLGNDDKSRAALCHEMLHVHFFAAGQPDERHGPVFQAELRALADKGAFKGVWASDDEKRDLRASLDRESARLDREFSAIKADARQIDLDSQRQDEAIAKLNARTAAANERGGGWPSGSEIELAKSGGASLERRVHFFNERVAAANADAKRFNQETSRYNLMVAYPDGLDEEMRVRRKELASGVDGVYAGSSR